MRLTIFLILLFNWTSSKAVDLGQGLINVNIEKVKNIGFYSDTLNSKPNKVIKLINNGNFISLENNESVIKWFHPEALHLDYYIFFMRVDTIIGTWFRVYYNNDLSKTYWIKKQKNLKFMTWGNFLLKRVSAITKLENIKLYVKIAPNDSSKSIKEMEKKDCFIATEIKGDWLKIKTSDGLDCSTSKSPIKTGWIRWRRGRQLMIDYGLIC